MLKVYVDQFIDAPLWKRLAISGVFLAVLLAGFYYFILMPLLAKQEVEENRLLDLQKEIQILRVKANKLPEFEEEVKVLDAELARALRELPDKKEMDTLLARISDKAKDSGLDVELFKPEGEQKRDFYAEVPVTLELRGEFHEIAGFFDEISHLDRIVNMNSFRISREGDRRGRGDGEGLKTTVVATSFRFLDESERPKEDDTKGNKRRKKKR